jgi:hypothetical protein
MEQTGLELTIEQREIDVWKRNRMSPNTAGTAVIRERRKLV